MPWGFPDTFHVEPPAQQAWPQGTAPTFRDDELKKQEFGIAMAKEALPFVAACSICGDDTKAALWIAANWIADPIVIAAKDLYLKTIGLNTALLDKDQFAARLIQLADEKVKIGNRDVYAIEAKDRVALFRLYSDVMGYTGKTNIDVSTKNFFTKLEVELVEAQPKATIIENTTAEEVVKPVRDKNAMPLELKLVG